MNIGLVLRIRGYIFYGDDFLSKRRSIFTYRWNYLLIGGGLLLMRGCLLINGWFLSNKVIVIIINKGRIIFLPL